MNVRLARILLLAAVITLLPPSLAAESAAPFTVEGLAFLAGSWQTANAPGSSEPAIEEHWTKPAGGTLIGMGRVAGGGKTYFFEFLRVETRPDGIYYVAQPKGGPPTAFKLVKLAPREAVFENLGHDFPKRIIYKSLENGGLSARTEGDGSEKEKPSEFLYRPMTD
jgi:hypothetical protein